jgi:hypothetical protein
LHKAGWLDWLLFELNSQAGLASAGGVDRIPQHIAAAPYGLDVVLAVSRKAHNVEAERQCCEIRLRAERKAGQLLLQMEKAKGARGNPGGRGAPIERSNETTTQTLAEVGISKDQSSQWQRLAAVPQPQFEAATPGPADASNSLPLMRPRSAMKRPRSA